jgi:hypothetical protein
MKDVNLYEEIFTLAHHLYERSGRIEGRALNNWLEAERIVRTLRKIAGQDGKRYILVNVPETRYAEKRKNGNEVNPRKKIACGAITKGPGTVSDR